VVFGEGSESSVLVQRLRPLSQAKKLETSSKNFELGLAEQTGLLENKIAGVHATVHSRLHE
jgi:hypothetical protein